jgi:hypothetical protein
MVLFLKFIARWLQIFRNFGIIKVDNKYVWKMIGQIEFLNIF